MGEHAELVMERDDVVEAMAEAARKAPLTGQGADAYMRRQINAALARGEELGWDLLERAANHNYQAVLEAQHLLLEKEAEIRRLEAQVRKLGGDPEAE